MLQLSCTHQGWSLRDNFIVYVCYLMADPKVQHSVHTGRALWSSPFQPPAQSRLGHQVAQDVISWGLETLQCGDDTTSLGPSPTSQLSLWRKSFPLSPASLALLSSLPTRTQNLLPRAAPSPASIAAGALPPRDRAVQCSGLTSMETLSAFSSHWSCTVPSSHTCTVALPS